MVQVSLKDLVLGVLQHLSRLARSSKPTKEEIDRALSEVLDSYGGKVFVVFGRYSSIAETPEDLKDILAEELHDKLYRVKDIRRLKVLPEILEAEKVYVYGETGLKYELERIPGKEMWLLFEYGENEEREFEPVLSKEQVVDFLIDEAFNPNRSVEAY